MWVHDLVGMIRCYVNARADIYGGTCVLDRLDARPYSSTETARHFSTFIPTPASPTFFTALSMVLTNGDVCRVSDWVLFKFGLRDTSAPGLACVREITVPVGPTPTPQYPRPGVILLQQADVTACDDPYRMPGVQLSGNYIILGISVSDLLHRFTTC